jgi:hypothetical protein
MAKAQLTDGGLPKDFADFLVSFFENNMDNYSISFTKMLISPPLNMDKGIADTLSKLLFTPDNIVHKDVFLQSLSK